MIKKNSNIFASIMLIIIALLFITIINNFFGKYVIVFIKPPHELNRALNDLGYKSSNILILSYSQGIKQSNIRILTKDYKLINDYYDSNDYNQYKLYKILDNNYNYIYTIIYSLLFIAFIINIIIFKKKKT